MTKKILSLIIAVLICTLSSLCVFASDTNFVVDEFDVLYEDEIEMLNAEALAVFNNTGFGVFFVYTYDEVDDDLVDYYTNGYDNFVIMFETEDAYKIRIGGTAKDHIDDEEADALIDIYADADTYRSGVSKFFAETAKLLPENSGSADIPESDGSLLVDSADILTDSEETALLEKLNRITKEYGVDVAIVTVDGIGDMTATSYVNFYFDNSDLGVGSSCNAVLFLIDMDTRQFRILSNGDIGAAAVSQSDIDSITDTVTSDLSNGNYADAFNAFVDECEYQINGEINGFPFKLGRNIIIALVIGLVVALIATGSMKGKLKSVKKQDAAGSYVKQGSLMLSESRDTFLYSRVTRTEKQSSSDNNRSSSGGSSRNVGGGSF